VYKTKIGGPDLFSYPSFFFFKEPFIATPFQVRSIALNGDFATGADPFLSFFLSFLFFFFFSPSPGPNALTRMTPECRGDRHRACPFFSSPILPLFFPATLVSRRDEQGGTVETLDEQGGALLFSSSFFPFFFFFC